MSKVNKNNVPGQGPELKGYYLVRKCKSTKLGWRLVHEVTVKGKKKQKAVDKLAWPSLGFSEQMTYEKAKERLSQLKSDRRIKRKKYLEVVRKTAERVKNDEMIDSAYLPGYLVELFQEHIKENHFGSDNHEKKLMSQWKTIQMMIHKLELDIEDFLDSKNTIYKYFMKKKISYSYVSKLLRMLNMWGRFVSRQRRIAYDDVPPPRGDVKGKISEAYSKSKTWRAEGAKPLSPKLLTELKDKMSHLPEQYNWLCVSLWFGLRPIEIESLKSEKNYNIVYNKSLKMNVLEVYQSKLTGVSKDLRWKYIPVGFKEQKIALKYIQDQTLAKPLNKTIQKYLDDEGYGSYSGRKGFTDLMLDNGISLEDVSMWLGHTTIETTWKHYKNKKKVSFKKIS